MKKEILIIILGILLIGMMGFVIAESENMVKQQQRAIQEYKNSDNVIGGQRDEHGCLMPAGYSWNETEQKCVREWEKNKSIRYQNENQGLGQQIRNNVRAGIYTSEDGEEIRVSEMAQNRIRLIVKNRSVDCDDECNLSEEKTGNKTKLKMILRDGKEKVIVIMPDKASEKALERLRLKVCNESNNCTLKLKEVGKANQTRAVYELQVERHRKLLAIFKIKALEKAEVDAETGNVIIVKKPWWAFLATSSD